MIVEGKNINLRTVSEEDAEFIYTLRRNEHKTKHLSQVSGTVETQREWIKGYKQRESEKQEFYFVIESKKSEKLGLVRLYDFHDHSFCWGSWIVIDGAPGTAAIESALMVYEFGFFELGFSSSHFEVRKGNQKVLDFHQRFGAKIVNQDDLHYYFNFEQNDYLKTRERYKKFLKS